MGGAYVQGKIGLPRLTGVFRRERLVEWLDAACDRALTLVTGPPGSGKTTLVADYLAVRAVRALWYRLDASDADPAAFFHHVGLDLEARGLAELPSPRLAGIHRDGNSVSGLSDFHRLWARLAGGGGSPRARRLSGATRQRRLP